LQSLIVGTAGHIDHGKSALVRALTGTDPDRLKEEKERGITIDLGFAHTTLAGGEVVSFVDVPGHERFVRNMLAGAHGIDAVLLVIAADESVMPQTREHFHICRLLGVARGLVVLSKCDAADAEMQAIAELEARELVRGSFLEGAPLLRVSARSGLGLDGLRRELATLHRERRARTTEGVTRLPVDRAFTLRGFGTVVTGTLVGGTLRVLDEVELLPAGRRSRVRGLQVHGSAVEQVEAGNRAAVNLAGVEVHEIARGDVLARPDSLLKTSMLDVELALLPDQKALADETRVRVHVASAEVLARVRLLEAAALRPGERALAQLRLERPAVACRDDRLIVRSYSPQVTIGGARVLDPLAPKRRARNAASLDVLRRLALANAPGAARVLLREAGVRGVPLRALAARVNAPESGLADALAGDGSAARLGREPVVLLAAEAVAELEAATLGALSRFHRENPLKAAMSREELRRRVFERAPTGALELVAERLAAAGKLRIAADTIALASHSISLSAAELKLRDELLHAVRAAGIAGVSAVELAARRDARLVERILRLLSDEGRVVRVGESQLVEREQVDALKVEVRRRWPPGSRLDVAGFKEMTGLSRKFVIPLLEYLDREKVTRRAGADRFVLGAAP
jgi:selenocysteine-specific elongation factor